MIVRELGNGPMGTSRLLQGNHLQTWAQICFKTVLMESCVINPSHYSVSWTHPFLCHTYKHCIHHHSVVWSDHSHWILHKSLNIGQLWMVFNTPILEPFGWNVQCLSWPLHAWLHQSILGAGSMSPKAHRNCLRYIDSSQCTPHQEWTDRKTSRSLLWTPSWYKKCTSCASFHLKVRPSSSTRFRRDSIVLYLLRGKSQMMTW